MRLLGRLAAVLCAVLGACASPASAREACPTSIDQAQLSLDYDAFDAAGWRNLLGRGCADTAVAQLLAYRDANADRLNDDQLRTLNFHAGQALAMSGRSEESLPHFERARGGDEEWSAYVDATLAFLRRDVAALARHRARYAASPGSGAMRLSVIDGFIACPTASYMEAVHCGMGQANH